MLGELEGIQGGYHETRHAQRRQQHAQLAPVAERKAGLAALTEREPKVRKDAERVQKEFVRAKKQLGELQRHAAAPIALARAHDRQELAPAGEPVVLQLPRERA